MARSRSRRAPAAWRRRCCSGPISPAVSLRLAAKGDAASGSGELTLAAADAATAKGTARWQPERRGHRRFRCGWRRQAHNWPNEADRSLFPRRPRWPMTMVTLSDATLTAGPLRLSASGPMTARPTASTGRQSLQSDEPGPARPAAGRSDVARPASHRACCSGRARQAAAGQRDSERRRRRSFRRRTRWPAACARHSHARRQARRAARWPAHARCAAGHVGAWIGDGKRRRVPAQNRNRRGQGDDRPASPCALLGFGRPRAGGKRASRTVGAQGCWRGGPGAGRARWPMSACPTCRPI